jgi:anti-sigma factor RsiW
MTCESIRSELVGFQFGVISDGARAAVEAHLVGCSACVSEFLALKRSIELAENESERPSEKSKSVLRGKVMRELGLGEVAAVWWERPLAISLALAALVIAVSTTQWVAQSHREPFRGGSAAVHASPGVPR